MIGFQFKQKKSILNTAVGAVLGVSTLCSPVIVQAAMPANAILSIDPAVRTCVGGFGTPPDSCTYGVRWAGGSWFDMAGNGRAALDGNDGIILGQTQAASGSHTGLPNGSESPGIDAAWNFFGNTGIHYTDVAPTIINNTGAGGNAADEVTLDLSGWTVDWNGINDIPLPNGTHAGVNTLGTVDCTGLTDGVAKVTCGTACADGDTYTLYYCATVPAFPSTGFENVAYSLVLTGSIVVPGAILTDKTIDVAGAGRAAIALDVGSDDGRVTEADLLAYAGGGIYGTITADSGYTNTGGYFNFKLTTTGGGTSRVVLPITPSTIPADAEYRKWNGTQWVTFTGDGTNEIASAASAGGVCPAVGDAAYDDALGLVEGHDCVRLTIEENGAYDLDTVDATVIEDPGGVGVGVGVFVDTRTSGTSGCSLSSTPVAPQERADWWLLAGFLTWLGINVFRRKDTRT